MMRILLAALLSLTLASCLIDAEDTFPKTRHQAGDHAGGDVAAGDPVAGDPAGDPGVTPPDPITNFNAVTDAEREILLTWTNPGGGVGVMVRGAIGDYPSAPTAGGEIFDGLGAQVTHSDQPGGVEIYYAAWTYVGSPRVYSTVVQTTATPTDSTPPAAPTIIDLTPSANTVTVAWTNPTDSDFAFVVAYRSTSPIPANHVGATQAYQGGQSSFTDTGLTSNTLYYYAIWAYDDALAPNESASALEGDATTISVAGEFEACGTCDPTITNLTCLTRDLDGAQLCVKTCGSAGDCGSGQYCDTDSNWFGDSFSFCWPTAAVNYPCLPNASPDACTDSECVTGASGASVCRDTCVDTSDCGTGLTCLVGTELEISANPCTIAGGQCDGSVGWSCHEFEPSNTCARPAGRCGLEAGVLTSFDEESIGAHIATAANQCDFVATGNFCPHSTSSAWSECLNLGNAAMDVRGGQFCSHDAECLTLGSRCMMTTGGSLCIRPINSCVLVCETEFGGLELTCPGGMTCGVAQTVTDPTDLVPGLEFLFPDASNGDPVACTSPDHCIGHGDTVCAQWSDGEYCTRNRKVCKPI